MKKLGVDNCAYTVYDYIYSICTVVFLVLKAAWGIIMLKISHVSKRYDGFWLQDISLDIPKGYIVGMLGENGAGKSTLLKIMLGYVKPDSGSVCMGDWDMWRSEDEQKRMKDEMGFVLNEELFSPYDTLLDNGRRYGKYYQKFSREEFFGFLQEFGLEEKRKYGKLSRGEKLKFQFAFALSHHPGLLLLDEPLGSFDVSFREKFMTHLSHFVEDGEHSVVLVSHLTQELDQIADYIALVHRGKLLDFSDIEELRERYRLVSGEKYKINLLKPERVVYREEGAFCTKALVRHNSYCRYDKELVVEVPGLEDILYYVLKGNEKNSVSEK